MSHPWMPFYVADYLADTTHLSTVEHGAYMLLIMHYWQQGSLPLDDAKLARICRMTPPDFADIRDTLSGLFGDGWSHKRIDAELARTEDKRQKRAESGRRGGEAKASKQTPSKPVAIASVLPQQKATNHNHSHKEEEDNKAIALSSDPVSEMIEIYHELMVPMGCPRVIKVTGARRASALRRLKDAGDMNGWRRAMLRARDAPHLTGDNNRGWIADFDFFMQDKSFTKLLEGSYDARNGNHQRQHRPASGHDNLATALDELIGGRRDGSRGPPSPTAYDDAERDAAGVYRIPH